MRLLTVATLLLLATFCVEGRHSHKRHSRASSWRNLLTLRESNDGDDWEGWVEVTDEESNDGESYDGDDWDGWVEVTDETDAGGDTTGTVAVTQKPVTETSSSGNEFSKCDGSSHGRTTSAKRIANGRQAKKGSFPYIATLELHYDGTAEVFCGGSILNEWWIISAAHCVYEELKKDKFEKEWFLKNFYVRVGEHDTAKDSAEEKFHKVDKLFQHRDYNHDGYTGHDMLLLKLKTPIKFTRFVRPVCMPDVNDNFKVGDTCFVAGFGKGNTPPSLLHQSIGKIISDEQCGSIIMKKSSHAKQFCTLGVRGNSCGGDSGGPVVCWDRKDSRWELAGLVSYGSKECNMKDAVNQRVSHFRTWIEATIKNN